MTDNVQGLIKELSYFHSYVDLNGIYPSSVEILEITSKAIEALTTLNAEVERLKGEALHAEETTDRYFDRITLLEEAIKDIYSFNGEDPKVTEIVHRVMGEYQGLTP